ncbi:MAG: MFS transporter [Rudaea sp.]|uniref:MFS transporter n=1 Tax=Rudaea sp. TaxID=2136325 RepID=UPI0039E45A9E
MTNDAAVLRGTDVAAVNSKWRVLTASLAGTTIEFFDFYIYLQATVLVFPKLFFPASDPLTQQLASFATFAVAFFTRPIGSALFGHFGDRVGRKATLVAALLTMGISTIVIGFLPTYAQIGIAAPVLLTLCRVGQGLGLGGEWGGAILLATENAPPGQRAWYGMFPQLGAPLGFTLSSGIFLVLSDVLSDGQFLSFGWRIPFLLSALLVVVGLYVRLKIAETPAFRRTLENDERVHVPIGNVFAQHGRALLLGVFACVATFVLFYLLVGFTPSWGIGQLKYPKVQFLIMQIVAMVFFAVGIVISAWWAKDHGARRMLVIATVLIIAFGFLFKPMLVADSAGLVLAFMSLGLFLMGLTYGPLGTAMAELFPTAVRYTGSSLAFNIGGLSASLTPFFATSLASGHGVVAVGWYLAGAALLTLLALLAMKPGNIHD